MVELPLHESQCSGAPLDSAHRIYLGVSLIVLGTVGVAANGWLVRGSLTSPLLTMKTHLLMLNLAITCLGRGLLAGFPFAGSSTLAGRWLFGKECCQFFAFLLQFFGMSQVAAITILAVERAVVARHSETFLSMQQYVTGILLCWISAAVWATPPLLGWGRYGCDPTAMSCSLEWSPNTDFSSSVYNICLLTLGGALSATIMCVSVWCAVSSEGRRSLQSAGTDIDCPSQRVLTKTVGVLVPGLCLMWLPQTLLIFWVVTGTPLPTALAIIAAVSSEASAVVPILACLACDKNMRKALFGILGTSTSSTGKQDNFLGEDAI